MSKRPLIAVLLTAVLAVPATGCLGTAVESPVRARAQPSTATLRWHLITAPRVVEASECTQGMSDVTTHVPLWGLALGVLTLGIVVPQWTIYSCAAPGRPMGARPIRTRAA